ncbi:MAG TPA: aryl-sulfate sulfotransferase [Terriglobia bacterium]|nr:aryl-sulfate sulfotransferase [Terriglobia bacterium]
MRASFRLLPYFAVMVLVWAMSITLAQNPPAASTAGPATQGVGLIRNEPGAYAGYTLISPLQSRSTFLIDMTGRVVKTWETDSTPASLAYLLESGNLLRAGLAPNAPFGRTAGGGGKMQEFNWNGELVWDYTWGTATATQHHDFLRMPNGNIMLLVKERKTAAESIAAGRIPSTVEGTEVQPDSLVEIKPSGKNGGEVVWEWRLWDHLIQDVDNTKANYGDVAAHPERVDINYNVVAGQRANPDWTHFNSVAYNAELDQLVVSLRNFSEIWIIDHSTTTREAAGSTGGRSGKGGDLLYRWGNPRAYRAGTAADQRLYGQHNAHWIPKGLPGAGNLLIFSNGDTRPGSRYSTVEEIVLPVDARGRYALASDKKFGPDRASWTYSAPNPTDFYSVNISGAHRLPNGNTLICSGAPGFIFEVTPQNRVVWQYNVPGFGGRGGPNARNVFRAYRFGPDFPGFAGKTLIPGKTLEEMAQ